MDFEEIKIMKQKCSHSKYVFFIFLMKIDCLIQCILTSDFLTSTSPNSAPSSSLFTRSPPFLLSLEKEAGLEDTTTKHEKIQDTLRQGKFPLTETGQGNPGGGK